MTRSTLFSAVTSLLIVIVISGGLFAQRGPGRGLGPGNSGPEFRGGRQDPTFQTDHEVFHFLLDNGDKIRRQVKNLTNGIETLTESDDPEVAAKIQEHVAAMYDRVEENRPIHMRDPLFRELFQHTDKIEMNLEDTEKGIRVVETSSDPYVAKLLKAHAEVVSLFINNGRAEAQKNHAVPSRDTNSQRSTIQVSTGFWKQLPSVVDAPNDNPMTLAKVELGKKLFFDPRLSLTGTVSCNSCHNVMEGGDDGRPTSMGIHGRLGPRNAPTVWNSAFQTSQFWDGRAATLEEQAGGPIVAQPEMGMPNHDLAVERLMAIPGYVAEFAKVFPEQQPVTIENAVKAIAAFERTLITPNSPYDRYVGGERSALTEQQMRGMKLFDGVGCTECHSGSNFNNWDPGANTVAFEEFPRSNESPFVARYALDRDLGRYEATKKNSDKHLFKTPTLRNITLTAPYFHNGAVPSLGEAVQVMSVTQLDTELSDEEVDDLVAFLSALEGEFPAITFPRLPSRSGHSILEDQQPAEITGH